VLHLALASNQTVSTRAGGYRVSLGVRRPAMAGDRR
jgi:hypothetical protein